MAYQVYCDGYLLHDGRDPENYLLLDPVVTVAANECGSMEFRILGSHQHYDKLRRMRSIIEVIQDGAYLFRGRVSKENIDFDNISEVQVDGIMACLGDTIVPPFDFTKTSATNKVQYLLNHVITKHNEQASEWQKLKLGNVTVEDPNGILDCKSDADMTAWEVVNSKLIDGGFGGYILPRYTAEGTYIDFLHEFTQVSPQRITFGSNLLDMVRETDASEVYTAMKPRGKKSITINSLADGAIGDDLYKKGSFVYSIDGVAKYGWRCVPVSESKFDKVDSKTSLKNQAAKYLRAQANLLDNSIEVTAVDLHFADEAIRSFKVGTSVICSAPKHGIVDVEYPLTELEIHLDSPQDTKITLNASKKSMSGYSAQAAATQAAQAASITGEIADYLANVEITQQDGTSAARASGTSYVSLDVDVSLEAGTYIVLGSARFAAGSNRRGLCLAVGGETIASSGVIQPGTTNGATRLQCAAIIRLDAASTVGLYGFQNSGSSVTVDGKAIQYIKLA